MDDDLKGRMAGQEDRGEDQIAPGHGGDHRSADGDVEADPQGSLLAGDLPRGWAPGTPIGHPDHGSAWVEQAADQRGRWTSGLIEHPRAGEHPSSPAFEGLAAGEGSFLQAPGATARSVPGPGVLSSHRLDGSPGFGDLSGDLEGRWFAGAGTDRDPGLSGSIGHPPDRAVPSDRSPDAHASTPGYPGGPVAPAADRGTYQPPAARTVPPGSRWTVRAEAGPEAGYESLSQPWAPPIGPWSPPTRAPRALSKGWLGLLLVVSLLSAAIGAGVAAVVTQNSQKTVVEKFFPNKSVLARPQDVQEVLAKVLPAVVSVSTQNVRPTSTFGGGNFVEGAGTGMIITSRGEVLTNNHVVAGATSVAVTLYHQTEQRQATVISTDPANDLALIQINGVSGLPRVNLGNSATVQQGDSVLAIGNALALAGGPTVTEGIVSALGRSLSARDPVTLASEHLTGLIQTDAPINPGNSGGPLVNSSGDVIGMNTAVATSVSGNAPAENIGFAIAVNTIKALLPQLRSSKTPVAPASGGGYMGVVVTNATPAVREQMGIVARSGAVVISVGPGTPAQRAGIRSADVILAVNNTPVASATDLTKVLERLRPGDRVTVTLQRGGDRLQVEVVLEARPGQIP